MRLIDADKLIAKWKLVAKRYEGDSRYWETGYILKEIIKDVENEPTIDAEPVKHGQWEWDGYVYDMLWRCSECSCLNENDSDYCPNCGAKIDEKSV